MAAFKDLTDQRFNKLVVLRRSGHIHGRTAWECQCDCGNILRVTGNALQRNNTKSCGCLNHVKTLVDIDWNDPESRNVRRRELYADKVAGGYKRVRTAEYKERKLEREKERRAENPEKAKEQDRAKSKRYRDNHPEKIAADNAKFRLEHPDYPREYHIAHPENLRHRNRKRYIHLTFNGNNTLTKDQWEEIKAVFRYRCAYCGYKPKHLTMDHITPLSKGGTHTASNIVPACSSCNSKKHAKGPLIPVQPLLLTIAPPDIKRNHDT